MILLYTLTDAGKRREILAHLEFLPVSFKIVGEASPNSFGFETSALIKATGFREYDARWWFGHPGSDREPDLNLIGVQALGMGLGTLIRRRGHRARDRHGT